jgi:poly-gamma-glutamate synthesis protein (capsule biosynthesis protein)
MRRFFTSCLFLSLAAFAQAQIVGHIPPTRPLVSLPDTATIFIMGDVMMHADQITNARKPDGTYSFQTYFEAMEGLIKESDLAVANMEFTLAGKPYTGYPCFSAPDGFEEYVAGCGVDVFLTANNHILDKGRRGLERTLERYSKMEKAGVVKHTGTALSSKDDEGRFPLYIRVRGIKVALVNFTYGTNQEIESPFPKVHVTNKTEIGKAIRKARETGAEFVVALPHWGIEYILNHSKAQGELAKWLVASGCDAVVGAHPHVVQDSETLDGIPVVYSLGNAVSNMSAINTRIGMAVRLRIATDRSGERRMLSPEYILTWCTRPGTLTDSYAVIPVRDFIGKRDLWKNPSDYDEMISSYHRVKEKTGIVD